MLYNTLENYYRVNFYLMQHHHYSLFELDSMIPFEREIYLGLLQQHLEEMEKKT